MERLLDDAQKWEAVEIYDPMKFRGQMCDADRSLRSPLTAAQESKLPCSLITDAGLTEFNGVPTNTCIAIGPWDPAEIDKITGHLKLL